MATSSPANSEGAGEAAAKLDTWRARRDHRRDPVRFRFIEALARRAAGHEGEVRRILDARLATLMAAYEEGLEELEAARCADGGARPAAGRAALKALVEHISRHAPIVPAGASPAAAVPGVAPEYELKTMRYFRSTWTRLSADRRLAQSLAQVPEKAGPLNSQQLVHRTLTLMREMSPGYLERFMAYADALSWLEQSQRAAVPASAPRAEAPKKSGRGKAR
ncbi:DUF2894 domain-containing protein [Variovorax sp. JS1663]|uniref:DUF2894 domain-containing protein n=1 Tax=Variovorax sp. JS1663 TaxID=1851577 RepID=UPI000B349667|nr:DUF2894 domain-containing protein [Variovorax sp. JS1663]OUM02542.1 hypothetical protein A8M77_09710 [Variovorax sp. JS1663]